MPIRMPWSRRHVSRRRRSARDIVCPYCFRTFPYWALRFRYEPTPSSLEPERVYPLPGALRARLNPFYKMPRDMPVGPHGRRFDQKVCPFCGRLTSLPLPYTAGVERSLILGLVGWPGAGVNTYRVSLIRRLGEPGSGFYARPMDDNTLSGYRLLEERLFSHRIQLVVSALIDDPWTYSVSPVGRNGESCTLVLWHTGNENFYPDRMEHLGIGSRLSKMDGLIFMVDPLQLPLLAPRLGGKPRLPASDFFGNVIKSLQEGLGSPVKEIPIPVAIVLTKADMLRDAGLIDVDSLWQLPVFHKGSYNLRLQKDIDAVFGDLVDRNGGALYKMIVASFQDYAFFGVSATGCAAVNGQYTWVEPIRVEDPLLWVLYRLGIIEGH